MLRDGLRWIFVARFLVFAAQQCAVGIWLSLSLFIQSSVRTERNGHQQLPSIPSELAGHPFALLQESVSLPNHQGNTSTRRMVLV